MKTNKEYKRIFKICVIGFVLISSIYVLYFHNNNILENFIISNDWSNCKINPSAYNTCQPIYDISYNWNSVTKTVDVSNISNFTFCEWEPNCSYAAMGNNIPTQQERLRLSNSSFRLPNT